MRTQLTKIVIVGFMGGTITHYKREDGTWDAFRAHGSVADAEFMYTKDATGMKNLVKFAQSKGYKVTLTPVKEVA